MSKESLARLNESAARLQARSASLRATMQRWADVMVAKLERRIPPSGVMSMREALDSEEYLLKKWKRPPHSFNAHTVRTQYLRRDYNAADLDYLKRVVMGSRMITADEANKILRILKPDTSRPKRKPLDADPDKPSAEYGQREPRYLSPEELIRSQFSGRALARELRRIRK